VSAVLVIAGADSSGGAGIARDLRTLADLHTRALCALTAVTAQTDAAVLATHLIPGAMLSRQVAAAFATAAIGAIKVGMLGSAAAVQAVCEALEGHAAVPLVLDPVLASSSGGELLDAPGRARLTEALLPRARLVTPNIPELAELTESIPAHEEDDVLRQGRQLLERGAAAVLVKGGHGGGPESIDLLVQRGLAPLRLSAPRSPRGMRGSGCALATAIAAALAAGSSLESACRQGKTYVTGLFSGDSRDRGSLAAADERLPG
jgi:hydroxymethylpyrimidine/phosphomethylpyrimidine kinase